MKKWVSLGIATLAALSLAACGNSNNSVNKDSSSSKAKSESVKKAKAVSESKAKAESKKKAKAASESKAKAVSESKAKAASESQAAVQSSAAASSASASSAAASQSTTNNQAQQQATSGAKTQGEINRERGYDPNGNPLLPGQDHAAGDNPDGTSDSWVQSQHDWAKRNGYENPDGSLTEKGQQANDEVMNDAH